MRGPEVSVLDQFLLLLNMNGIAYGFSNNIEFLEDYTFVFAIIVYDVIQQTL